MKEKEWVQRVAVTLESAINERFQAEKSIRVQTGKRLAYTQHIQRYEGERAFVESHKYETDLLLLDALGSSGWIPRVVIEAKLDRVTTHDALTYSAKAATHKAVHPYLRYGILIGNWGESKFPVRLIRHGAHFDFMATWRSSDAAPGEWAMFMDVVADEIKASRALQQMFEKHRSHSRKAVRLLHRPLRFQ